MTQPKKAPKSPSENPSFKRMWELHISDVYYKEDFIPGHLELLRVLCDLYVEYDKLWDEIDLIGYSYTVSGRNGDQQKTNPCVAQLNRTRADIAHYSKLLNLNSKKAPQVRAKEEESEQWE